MNRISTTICAIATASISALIFASVSDGSPVSSKSMTVAIAHENHAGFTAEFMFPPPKLKLMPDGCDSERLWIDLPGAILNFDQTGIAVPTFTRLVAVPEGYSVRACVRECESATLDAGAILSRANAGNPKVEPSQASVEVSVGEPGWMRWMRVVPVVIRPAGYSPERGCVLAAERLRVDFEFIPDGTGLQDRPSDPGRYRSAAFEDLFNALLLNPRDHLRTNPGGDVIQRGSYIIITDSVLSRVQTVLDFAAWKRRKGFNTVIAPIYSRARATTSDEIKAYIQDAYDNWERPPEFVLLLGDENQTGIQMPAFLIPNPQTGDRDVTDHPYSLLRGYDDFPDIFVGRISSDSPNPSIAQNVLNRVLIHEQSALDFEDQTAFHRATLFAGNFTDGGIPILSPVETMRWLGERLREKDFDVEEFYYRGEGDNISPEPIIESINRGVNLVAYRGRSDVNGTDYPQFYRSDLDQLDNGPLLPIFTFFNSDLGDFGDENEVSCFGEYSINRGTRRAPTGALEFYGSSDLHAQTRYNNAALVGFYFGLLYEDLRVMGALMLRSKMEIWNSFPHERGDDKINTVEFYFNVYNLLGDPELNFYLDPPIRLEVTHPDTLHYGDSSVGIAVHHQHEPIPGAIVTMQWNEGNQVSVTTDDNGVALVPVRISDQQSVEVTVIAHQAAPYMANLPVVRNAYAIGVDTVQILNEFDDDRLVTGSPVTINITLENTGLEDVHGVTAVLSSQIRELEVLQGSALFGDIRVNAIALGRTPFQVEINPALPNGYELPFTLDITDADNRHYRSQFRLPVSSARLSYVNHYFERGAINPGERQNLVLTVQNMGSLDLERISAKLFVDDNSVVIETDSVVFGDAPQGEVIDCEDDPFAIRAQAGTVPGRIVTLKAYFYDRYGKEANNVFFNITIGVPAVSDPLGPDRYGYYAYEDVDNRHNYPQAPEYQWIELDPAYGGAGADRYTLADDTTIVINLPFAFVYYGAEYDVLSVCSNGWMSFQNTWMPNFYNWGLPSPLGPHTMIAPFWDDLVGANGEGGRERLKIFTRYDRNQNRFLVEWSRVVARSLDRDATETFEVILYNPAHQRTPTGDGEIVFQYHVVECMDRNELNYATVGIQDWDHRCGLEVTYALLYPEAIDSLRPGRAIKFTTVPPDTFLTIKGKDGAYPAEFHLFEPHPNPFNGIATITYELPQASPVSIRVYDLSGRWVTTLVDGYMKAGQHTALWDAGAAASGIYLVRMEASQYRGSMPISLIK